MNPPIVKFTHRYSATDAPDNLGRWAIIAYAGRFKQQFGNYRGKCCRWNIAWISKIENKYLIHYYFPNNAKHIFDTLPQCKIAIKQAFTHFVKTVLAENN
jgi:hypothetical protein